MQCPWLVDFGPTEDGDPVILECGAPARELPGGGFECEAGHGMGSMFDELGPFGAEWQREQRERHEEGWAR